jgi:hypothetical protein
MFEEIGIIGKDSWHIENGKQRAMINFTKLSMLHHGALLQVGNILSNHEERIATIEEVNKILLKQLETIGVLPEGGRNAN